MNYIHHTAIIGEEVKLGDGNVVGPFALISGNVNLGDGNWIGPYSSIGGSPEIRGSNLPASWELGPHTGTVIIGSRNVFRDGCVIHAGHFSGTKIGDDCYIMNQVYIAHDCNIGNSVTLSCNVALGGHVNVQEGANLGIATAVHQRRTIGSTCMVGMGSVVTKDIVPFSKAYGNPCKVQGANLVGMQRVGLSESLIAEIADALETGDREKLRIAIPAHMNTFEDALTINF